MNPDEYKYMYALEKQHWWFVSRRNFIVCLIKSLGMSSPTILDVGSGTGGNLDTLNKLGETVGLDVSKQAIEFCKKRGLDNIIQCSAEKIAYSDETFDIITCIDVLEHVLNPHNVLLELRRVLKDEGRIIITVPAFRTLWSQHDIALGHLRRYEKKSLMHDLNGTGLKIDKIGYFFFTSFFVIFVIRSTRKLLSKKKLYSDVPIFVPKFLNEILKFLFNIEIKISRSIDLPFGTTLYAVASKDINSLAKTM